MQTYKLGGSLKYAGLSRLSSRSVLYWSQAFSHRHYRVSTPAGIALRTRPPDRNYYTCAPKIPLACHVMLRRQKV